MSQDSNNLPVLAAFNAAIESYEALEELFSRNQGNVLVPWGAILISLKLCIEKLDEIIRLEGTSSNFLIELCDLKQQLFHFTDLARKKVSTANNQASFKHIPEASSSNNNHVTGTKRKCCETSVDTIDKKLLDIVKNFKEDPKVVRTDEIAGLHGVKKALKSILILPQTQPQLFNDRKISNTILLFGPPGTGKTKIVHALACEAYANLYSISVGNILSSYVGQTEKTIQALFQYIKLSGEFSILFIDEVDGFCCKRKSNEQDYSRRLKTEFMCQLNNIEDCRYMFVICATNCPWDLDSAILRRFQKRIYVPLLDKSERQEFFKINGKGTPFEQVGDYILTQTEGFSGSDLSDLISNALNIPLIELQDTKIWKLNNDGFYEPVISADYSGNIVSSDLSELPSNSVRARPANEDDLLTAIHNVTITVSRDEIAKFEDFIHS